MKRSGMKKEDRKLGGKGKNRRDIIKIFKCFLGVQQKHTFSKYTLKEAKENRGFHKSAALRHIRVEEANRKRRLLLWEGGKKNKQRKSKRHRKGWKGGGDREEERTPCYHGVQRKTSCLQPIHQLPATKFCLSHSLFSSSPLPPPSAFFVYLS